MLSKTDKWFNNLPISNHHCTEVEEVLRLALETEILSNDGRLRIQNYFYDGLEFEHFGAPESSALSRLWRHLSDEDKEIIMRTSEDAKKRPLAPNGKPSNLSKEDWLYVRTPEFKAFFGDWENDPEHASKCVDENGEPMLVYHGSNKDFDAFDMSMCGKVTGKEEWENNRTGEKIASDNSKGMFFSTSKAQAVSYIFLSRFYYYDSVRHALDGLYPCFNHGVNYDFKSREDVLNALRLASDFAPSIRKFFSKVEENPDKRIFVELFQGLRESEQNILKLELQSSRELVREMCALMQSGGLSNEFHNCVLQQKTNLYLKNNIIRLAHGDKSVKTTFGTFRDYCEIIMAGGNETMELNFDDNHRCYCRVGANRTYLDVCDFGEILKIMNDLDNTQKRFSTHCIDEIHDAGYDKEAVVYGVFLNTRSPLEHDYQGSAFPDMYLKGKYPTAYVAARQVRKAITEGNDSVVYRNVVDPFYATTFGVFSSDQILIREKTRSISSMLNQQDDTLSHEVRRTKLYEKSEKRFLNNVDREMQSSSSYKEQKQIAHNR